MVDTQRIQNAPQCVSGVAQVAASRARDDAHHRTHVLDVTTFFPLDIETIARMLEDLCDRPDINAIEHEGLSYVVVDEPDAYNLRMLDMESGEHLTSNTSLLKHLSVLREDTRWMRRVRDQHELLHIAAEASSRALEPAYFTSRTELPSAKVQSLLHDLCASGHVLRQTEPDGSHRYLFPELTYPKARLTRNMELLSQLEPVSFRSMTYVVFAAATLLIMVLVYYLAT